MSALHRMVLLRPRPELVKGVQPITTSGWWEGVVIDEYINAETGRLTLLVRVWMGHAVQDKDIEITDGWKLRYPAVEPRKLA